MKLIGQKIPLVMNAPVSESTLKKDDFPTFGRPFEHKCKLLRKDTDFANKPTIPILRLFPGRPRRTFLSGADFFGGIFFLASRITDVEKKEGKSKRRDVVVYRWRI
jgi:hypothetical protein